MSPSKSKRRTTRTGGSPRSAAAASARARLLAEQAQAEKRRRQLIFVIVPIAVVLVAVGAFVVIRFAGTQNTTGPQATTASDTVVTATTTVPPAVLDQIGPGTLTTPPRKIDAPALEQDGKPKILYVGAEFCPFCAAERWAMVVALSRFGTFSGLGQTTSSAEDVYPSTPTLSFHGSSFTSSTIAFTGVETRGNQVVNGQYAPLDTLTPTDQQIFDTFNSPPYVPADSAGSIPFVDIGGTYLINGASFNPQVLQGKTHEQIAAALSDPSSDIAKAVNGSANVITAAICARTADKPANVCTSTGVTAAAAKLQ